MTILVILHIFISFSFCLQTGSDRDYQLGFEVLRKAARKSDYHMEIIDQVKSRIESGFISSGRYLDIGTGTGELMSKIGKLFPQLTIVEPNQEFFSKLDDSNFLNDSSKFNVHFEEYFEMASQQNEKFDFILCSHVLYHVSVDEWESFISKMLGLLSENGVAAIVMETHGSVLHKYLDSYKKNYLGLLSDHVKELNGRKEYSHSFHSFELDSRKEMELLFNFLVMENCFVDSNYHEFSEEKKIEIERKIQKDLDEIQKTNGFSLEMKQEILFIFKTSSNQEMNEL